ncbi:hypothetical protein HYH03_015426 [Edaphochlamys debaryana]|uniref:Uncharacterized protein n=1 Tax=Edaphochlamys debaryana TaxID=47281 RepID=A0A835XN57_9CHLO|nr:hypothetical protein HYH03_015426 [Edaphochlamys debaryana]|eukprot:KAG2485843.1 hypothetical protein HYH03_015426 [Edaphochlamys debaryana]
MAASSPAQLAARLKDVRTVLAKQNVIFQQFVASARSREEHKSVLRDVNMMINKEMSPTPAPGLPGAMDAGRPNDEASVDMGVRLTQVLLSTQAVPTSTAALQAAAARMQAAVAAGTGEGDGQYLDACRIAGAALLTLMFAGRILRRTANATFAGKLAARSPVPGGGGATVADGAAALLHQLTAPELAAALAGVLETMRRRCAPAAAAASSPETIARALQGLTGARLDLEAVRGVLGSGAVLGTLDQMWVMRANISDNACAVVYEIIACSHLAAALRGQEYQISGGGSSLLGAASAFPPAAAAPAAAAALPAPPGLSNLLAALRRLFSSLAASSLFDAMAGAVLGLPPPPAGVPYGAAAAQGVQDYLREIKHVVCCAATAVTYLAIISQALAGAAELPSPGGGAAAAAALAREGAALLTAPRVLWLQRALLERWLMDQAAAVAEAARTGKPPRFDASANDDDAAAGPAGSGRSGGGGGGGSCGVPLLDRVSVVRLVRRALASRPGAQVDPGVEAEKYDSALATAMLTQTEPLLSTLLVLRSPTRLSSVGAAGGGPPPLASAPECAALMAGVMEAACGVVRAGGSLGMQEWSLRVVRVAGAVLQGLWAEPRLTPATELLKAAPAAAQALWWGLGAVVAETRRPGDPHALSPGGASSYGKSEWEAASLSLLKALDDLASSQACGLPALSLEARVSLSTRLSACGWLRTAHSRLRLQAARRPEGAGEVTIALIVKLLPTFLRQDLSRVFATAPATAASAAELADLLLTLSKVASRAALRTEQAAAAATAAAAAATTQLSGAAASYSATATTAAGAGAAGAAAAMGLPALTAAQRALEGPEALVQRLQLLVPMQLKALGRPAPAPADPESEAGEQAAALRSAQLAFLRGYVRATVALAEAWRPLLAASLGPMRMAAACAQAGRDPTEAGLGMPEAQAVAAAVAGALVVAEAVPFAATSLEQGLRQGWLAAPSEQPAARLAALVGGGAEAAAFLAEPVAALALEGEGSAGVEAALARALAQLLVEAAAQEGLGPQVGAWLRPAGEGGGQAAAAAAGAEAGRLVRAVRILQGALQSEGEGVLTWTLMQLQRAGLGLEAQAGGEARAAQRRSWLRPGRYGRS